MNSINAETQPAFLTKDPETFVGELFTYFEKDGRWHSSLAEKHRCELLSDTEREAEREAYYVWFYSLTDAEKLAHTCQGDFGWVLSTDKFGGVRKTIQRPNMTIHAFHLGHGHSDDPNLYVIHLPGHEADLESVYCVSEKELLGRWSWVIEPITELYARYQANGPQF